MNLEIIHFHVVNLLINKNNFDPLGPFLYLHKIYLHF